MASPFRVFRKHQKVMIASLVLMAMFSFILVGPIMQLMQQDGSPQDPVVVETEEYGDIKSSQLQLLKHRRQQVLNFLQAVQLAVIDAKRNANANLPASSEDRVIESADVAQQFSRMIGPSTDEGVVDTWLLARHGEELGLAVSDTAVNDFIRNLTERRLGSEQLEEIINQAVRVGRQAGSAGASQRRLFDLLRHELLALQVQMMFNVSMAGTTPAQRWEYYTRLKRLATVEVIAVPVSNSTDKVKDPGNETLREFFDQYKENYPDPTSPEPGFRKPHQIAVRYFKAELDKFISPDVVTDEEVKEFYQENKEYLDRIAPRATEEPATEEPATEEPATEEPATEEPATEEPAIEEPAIEENGDPDAATPSDEPKAEDGGEVDAEKPSDEKPAESAGESDEPVTEPPPGDTSSGRLASPFRLTSFLQEEAGEPSAEIPAEEPPAQPATTPAEPAAPAAPAPEPGVPSSETETPGATEDPAAGSPQAPPQDTPDDGASDDGAPDDGVPDDGTADEPKQPEDPLAGPLGDMIRRQLAAQKIEELFARIKGRMNRYRNDYVRYDVDRLTDPNAKPPQKPDFEALIADSEGVTTDETSLMSPWDFQDDPSGLGRSFVGSMMSAEPFARHAFGDGFGLYTAAQSSEIGEDYRESNRYLFWKIEDSEEKTPEFDDPGVRKQVLQAWKLVEARKLAIEAAEDLVDEARKAGVTLANTFVERLDITVVSSRPFSWMTYGNVPLQTTRTPPRLSQVTGVEMAGPDFMRTVFGLKRGQIAVAMNHPKTIAYVVRVSEINPTENSLWAQFEVDSWRTYADAAGADRGRMAQAWREDLESTAGLKWLREPRRQRGE